MQHVVWWCRLESKPCGFGLDEMSCKNVMNSPFPTSKKTNINKAKPPQAKHPFCKILGILYFLCGIFPVYTMCGVSGLFSPMSWNRNQRYMKSQTLVLWNSKLTTSVVWLYRNWNKKSYKAHDYRMSCTYNCTKKKTCCVTKPGRLCNCD